MTTDQRRPNIGPFDNDGHIDSYAEMSASQGILLVANLLTSVTIVADPRTLPSPAIVSNHKYNKSNIVRRMIVY